MTHHCRIDNLGVARVVRSDDPKFERGDYVVGYLGASCFLIPTKDLLTRTLDFAEYSIYPAKPKHALKVPLRKVDKIPGIPLSALTGTLGMPGMTSYQGIKGHALEALKTVRRIPPTLKTAP